jgi:hypothetical protein
MLRMITKNEKRGPQMDFRGLEAIIRVNQRKSADCLLLVRKVRYYVEVIQNVG